MFSIAAVVWFLSNGLDYPFFIAGLILIALISFLDDVLTLNNKIRLSVHLFSVLLMFQQWGLFAYSWFWLVLALVFVIGTINAYNFMDGINGITGWYSFVTLATLVYIEKFVVHFIAADFLIIVGLSVLVFNFFNSRRKAKCFAGDVGSVSMAFILVFAIGQLIIQTQNFAYIFLLLVYGLDTATTVFFRKLRGENIFEAHRSHFYQYLSNQLKKPHLSVATAYSVVQLLFNIIIVVSLKERPILVLVLFLLVVVLFFILRFLVEGKSVLLGKVASS